MRKILIVLMAMCCYAQAETVEDGYWPKGEVVSGKVIGFSDFAGYKRILATVALNSISIPEAYAARTKNCKAYLIQDSTRWNLMRIQCDYEDNKQVRVYYWAEINVPPFNIGDEINITASQPVPIAGYFMMLDSQYSDVNDIQHYSNENL